MRRHPANPILTREAIPDLGGRLRDVSSVFNPGAIRVGDEIRLLLRVQTRGRETVWMVAESLDGFASFQVRPQVIEIEGLSDVPGRVFHAYDARLTRIDGHVFAMFALDTDRGCRLAVARSDDALERFELLGVDEGEDNRNGVLFPERWGGAYWRLDRPNRRALEGSLPSGDAIVLSRSSDLVTWEAVADVAKGRWRYWDELIGAGPPPIRVQEGWLLLYHGIATHGAGTGLYQAGVMLLDGEDPSRVLGRSRENILEPRELHELVGQVPGVVFPSGLVEAGGRLLVYYGAADTCIGLATTTVAALLAACGGLRDA